MRQQQDALTLGVLIGDLRLLLILVIAARVLSLLVFEPLRLDGVERGLTAGGDFQYYFQLAALSERGLLPFRDWWSEFPPVQSFLITLVFQLAGRGDNYSGFAFVLSLIYIAADIGNLLLVKRIGTRVYSANTGIALAWIYALLTVPAVFVGWNFEPLVAFFLLFSLALLIEGRHTASALWAGIGALVKFTPAVTVAAALRFRSRSVALRFAAVALGLFAGVYVLLFLGNPSMTLPSLTAQFNKASYQTVWALLDGNYRTGNFGPAEERLDPANSTIVQGNPAVIPGFVRLIGALAIGAFVFVRTRRQDARGVLSFVTIALLIFFLQAQGWSPQWMAQIVPLLILCFPTRQGILIVVLLSAVTFAEYPFLFLRTGDTGGEIAGALRSPFIVLVIARTLLLVGVCVALYRRLRQPIADL